MSDLKLVAPDQPTPLERLLMNAAANEAPSTEQRLRVRQALGLSVVTLTPPPLTHMGRAAVLGKTAIGVGLVASAIVALMFAGAFQGKAGVTQPALPPSTPVVLAAPSTRVPADRAGEPNALPLPSPLPPVEVAAASNGPVSKLTPRSVSSISKGVTASNSDDVSEQLKLIDTARAAVATGDTGTAAKALATYSSHFPRGSFGQEATVLHIETLDLQGNHGQAAKLAKSFIASHPNSPHVSLVQRIAGRTP